MARSDPRSYRFGQSAHWAVCGLDGFESRGDDLVVGGAGGWQLVSGAPADRNALALSALGEIAWLRRSGELVIHRDGEVSPLGVLPVGASGVRLDLREDLIWLADGRHLRIFHRYHLQALSAVTVGPVTALAPDASGAWCLIRSGANSVVWQHFDRSGRRDRRAVPCPDGFEPLAGARDPRTGRLYILDVKAVFGRDPCAEEWVRESDLAPLHCRFEPRSAVVGCDGVLHLHDPVRGVIWSVAERVRVAQRQTPGKGGRDGLLAAGEALAFADRSGVHRWLDAAAATSETSAVPGEAILLTPTLISPRGAGGGWQRARIGADLPPGTALSVRIAASDDDAFHARLAALFARPDLSATERLTAVEGLLPWDEAYATDLSAEDDPLSSGRYDVPLDGITAPYLWLRLRLHVPPTSAAATLRWLDVRYPGRSWIDDLPAIYRAEPHRAAALRRFLAALETVFEDLEERIARLPDRIAADHRDDAWSSFLLSWVGLPLPRDLPSRRKREFLAAVPELLARRGTIGALERALRIVLGGDAHVADHGAAPLPWVLGSASAPLGRGSHLVRQRQRGFVIGCDAALGVDRIGRHVAPAAELVAQRTQSLQIETASDVARDPVAQSAIDAVLDHFLPAACRYRLSVAPPGRALAGRRLGRDTRLPGAEPGALGATLALSCTPLRGTRPPGARLDHSAHVDALHRLS